MLTRNDSRPAAAARVDLYGYSCNLYPAPSALPVTSPGVVTLILGNLPSGRPLAVTVTSLEWLDDLESAVRAARARAIVEAGMTPGAAMGTRP